ncbi:ATP-dependent exoDNAse (exonuclease V) alpha subunit [Spirosoma lacussanchae]|uniref:ATP-dependent DNA helicase n=1 Tax=Spirosoma lacussanchae TaxID=1884249 RepID=UPI0011087E5B|nr:ATP-dependent RecD-like DNA helicase [Spirosoma lacussanchae]
MTNNTSTSLNNQQAAYFSSITNSLMSPGFGSDAHILKGSAGTGKTFLTRHIVSHLLKQGIGVVQIAPTGKAAKNMASGSSLPARTIHSAIYKIEQLPNGLGVRFMSKPNDEEKYTVYVVDESSMISDTFSRSERFVQAGALLSDLIGYARRGNAQNKFLFIGDPCQLPPVQPGDSENYSPALQAEYLHHSFGLDTQDYFLSEVMRARAGSYIIDNATYIRDCIEQGLQPDNSRIQVRITGKSWQMAQHFERLYDPANTDKVILIANSNKDVNYWNRAVRKQFGYEQDQLHVDDQVVVHQTWQSNGQTVFNGETGYVRAIGKTEQYAGLTFADVELAFQNADGGPVIVTAKTLLDTLSTDPDSRGVLDEEMAKHFHAEMQKHTHGRIESSPFYNPIMLRFGYAMTCHKAQGSEWDNVIIHRNALYADYQKTSLRWRYTALTRARKELYTWAA